MPPIDCEDQELLDGFLAETTELLEKLDDDLITLEKASDDTDLMNRIFRSIHTIKGASSFLGFDLLVKVAHKTEDVLNRLRKGELGVNPEIMDVILEATDLVKLLVSDIKAGDIKERETEGTINKLLPFLLDTAGAPQSAAVHQQPPKQSVVSTEAAAASSSPATADSPVASAEPETSADSTPIPPPATVPVPAPKPASDVAQKKAPLPPQPADNSHELLRQL